MKLWISCFSSGHKGLIREGEREFWSNGGRWEKSIKEGERKTIIKLVEFGLAINTVSTIVYICNFLGQTFDADSL